MGEIVKSKFNREYKTIDKFTWSHGKDKVTVRIDLCKHWNWVKFDDGNIHKVDHAEIHMTRYKDPLQREAPSPLARDGYKSIFMPRINSRSFIKMIKAELDDPKNIRKYKQYKEFHKEVA